MPIHESSRGLLLPPIADLDRSPPLFHLKSVLTVEVGISVWTRTTECRLRSVASTSALYSASLSNYNHRDSLVRHCGISTTWHGRSRSVLYFNMSVVRFLSSVTWCSLYDDLICCVLRVEANAFILTSPPVEPALALFALNRRFPSVLITAEIILTPFCSLAVAVLNQLGI